MKTLAPILSMVVAATLWPQPSPAEDADALPSLQIPPQMRSMLAELRKGTDLDLAAGQSAANPIAPLIALAAALFQEPIAANGPQRPAPRTPAIHPKVVQATDTDRPAEGAPSDPLGTFMALVTRVFDAAPHETEMSADELARLTPQIQAASTLAPKTEDGSQDRAPQGAPGGMDKAVAPLMALLSGLLSQSDHGDQAQITPAQLDQVAKLIPQVQSMVSQLLKEADIDVDNRDGAPANRRNRRNGSASTARDGGSDTAKTDGLTSGTLDGSPRMTDQEWRQLFPLRK